MCLLLLHSLEMAAALALLLLIVLPSSLAAPLPPSTSTLPLTVVHDDAELNGVASAIDAVMGREEGAERPPVSPSPRSPSPSSGGRLSTLVSNLLASLLHETLYQRMENLLLDPDDSSNENDTRGSSAADNGSRRPMKHERRKIVDSAVRNYQQQEAAQAGENFDFTKLAGYWIRETPEPRLLASTYLPSESRKLLHTTPSSSSSSSLPTEAAATVDFGTEKYKITDLFTTTTTTSTTTPPKISSASGRRGGRSNFVPSVRIVPGAAAERRR